MKDALKYKNLEESESPIPKPNPKLKYINVRIFSRELLMRWKNVPCAQTTSWQTSAPSEASGGWPKLCSHHEERHTRLSPSSNWRAGQDSYKQCCVICDSLWTCVCSTDSEQWKLPILHTAFSTPATCRRFYSLFWVAQKQNSYSDSVTHFSFTILSSEYILTPWLKPNKQLPVFINNEVYAAANPTHSANRVRDWIARAWIKIWALLTRQI